MIYISERIDGRGCVQDYKGNASPRHLGEYSSKMSKHIMTEDCLANHKLAAGFAVT